MSEIVDKAARAIYDVDRIAERDWNDAPASTREDCLACARAAIEAMREPTEQMLAVAGRYNHPRDAEVWRAMIDAALAE